MASHSQPSDAGAANDSDDEFDPSADMMVNDFDDEHTLEEEEENGDNDNEEEIDDLQRESEMPLEELLAMYGCGPPGAAKAREKPSSSSEAEVTSSSQPSSSCQPSQSDGERLEPDSEVSAGSSHDYWRQPSSSGRLLFTESDGDEDEDDDDEDDETYDENYVMMEEAQWKRQIQVGPDHQADVPDGLEQYDDASQPYEEPDVILWDPSKLSEQEVDKYLSCVKDDHSRKDESSVEKSSGDSAKHLFEALSLLHDCGYNADEAIKQKEKLSAFDGVAPETITSPEADAFEIGLKLHGKDFHTIQKDQVPNRCVRELVQYYYSWKKTDRFKSFLLQLDELIVTKFRTDKRKFQIRNGLENSIEDSDITSASGVVVTSPTSKTFPPCPSHSLIPAHYGHAQGNRGTVVQSAENEVTGSSPPFEVANGFVKEAEPSGDNEDAERLQIRGHEGIGVSLSTSSTSTTASVNPSAANLSDKSIDCK